MDKIANRLVHSIVLGGTWRKGFKNPMKLIKALFSKNSAFARFIVLLLVLGKRFNRSESKFKMALTLFVTLYFIGYGLRKYHQFKKIKFHYPKNSKVMQEVMESTSLSQMVSLNNSFL
jgi:hypothetical protein